MMRAPHQPLAHLVDAAAEAWLAAERAPVPERQRARREISQAFRIGDNPELTFHGQRFLLIVSRNDTGSSPGSEAVSVRVHKIAAPE